VSFVIAPPSHRLPDAAQLPVLVAAARRRRLAAGLASVVLAGPAVAVRIGAWPRPPAAAAGAAPGSAVLVWDRAARR
jgi:hypothetical protein